MTPDPHLLTGLGAALAIALSCLGSATASSVAATYAMRTKGYMSHVPIVVAGVLGIYGIIIAALLVFKLEQSLDVVQGYRYLSAGLAVGLSCLASGGGMSNFLLDSLYGYNSSGTRNFMGLSRRGAEEPLLEQGPSSGTSPSMMIQTPQPVTLKFFLMLTFLEALGLYGLIVALLLIGK
jgi:ATP synthase proteolipid subunit